MVGELHGIEQNGLIVRYLLDELLRKNEQVTLAFEWLLTTEEGESLQAFTSGLISEFKTPQFFLNSDGRVTSSHIALLQYVRNINKTSLHRIHVYAFDGAYESRETMMAENLVALRQKVPGVILVQAGVVHVERRPISLPETMAHILSRNHSIFSTFIHYERGKVNVEGALYDVRDSATQQAGPQNAFDGIINVPEATPFMDSIPLTISS